MAEDGKQVFSPPDRRGSGSSEKARVAELVSTWPPKRGDSPSAKSPPKKGESPSVTVGTAPAGEKPLFKGTTASVAAGKEEEAATEPPASGESASSGSAQVFDMTADSDDEAGRPRRRPSAAQVFDLTADSNDEAVRTEAAGHVGAPQSAEEAGDLAKEVRNRLIYLSLEDQQTVCRRECQLAQKAEEALLRQMQLTIERYSEAMDTARAVTKAVASGACTDAQELAARKEGSNTDVPAEGGDGGATPQFYGLPPELMETYEARVSILLDALAAIRTEPMVCLPRLTPMESVKGFALASYTKANFGVNRIKENPRVYEVAGGVAGGVQGALSSLASRWRGAAAAAAAAPPTATEDAWPEAAKEEEEEVAEFVGATSPGAAAAAAAAPPPGEEAALAASLVEAIGDVSVTVPTPTPATATPTPAVATPVSPSAH